MIAQALLIVAVILFILAALGFDQRLIAAGLAALAGSFLI